MKCPADEVNLIEKQGEGFVYHECPECKGLWMRHRALRTLVHNHNPKADIVMPRPENAYNNLHNGPGFDTNRITKCPVDGADYYEHAFGSVIMDICPTCDGVWLDQGELEKMTEELDAHSVSGLTLETVFHNIGAFFAHYFTNDKKTH